MAMPRNLVQSFGTVAKRFPGTVSINLPSTAQARAQAVDPQDDREVQADGVKVGFDDILSGTVVRPPLSAYVAPGPNFPSRDEKGNGPRQSETIFLARSKTERVKESAFE